MLGGSAAGRVFFSHHIVELRGRCGSRQVWFAASNPAMAQILQRVRAEFNRSNGGAGRARLQPGPSQCEWRSP
jgi:hypothetical protein